MQHILTTNLLSPAVLFFVLGLLAALVKSDLKFPTALSESLSLYLLAAIGLKGGVELASHPLSDVAAPAAGTMAMGIGIPLVVFGLCRLLKLDRAHSAAVAATYGSVSIVTFGAAVSYLSASGIPYESFMTAMVVLMESPAILVSLLLLRLLEGGQGLRRPSRAVLGITPQAARAASGGASAYMPIIRESLFGKSVLLLVGALAIGFAAGEKGLPAVKPLFIDLYPSVLVLFLLGMGLAAGERISELRAFGGKMILMAILMPLIFGAAGVVIGGWCGLSVGGMTLMGVLGASSSYIAAPAAMRQSVPEANPSLYLGMSLGITFPFNLALGLPLYVQLAQWIHG